MGGICVGGAFSAGLGMAMGLIMGQYFLQTMRPLRKVEVKPVIICQACAAQNPLQNKFCGNCGKSLYPSPKVTCQNCGSIMLSTLNFCGNCGKSL